MTSLLLAVIYLAFTSLGLPDSLLGSAWPTMQGAMGVPSSYAGYVSMTISFMTIVSSLLSPRLIQRFATKWIVIVSIALTVLGLIGFSCSSQFGMLLLFSLPYGLGAGSIDAALNHYVANHYSVRVMNFLHCFYGLGAVISPNIMALALKYARWNEGYRWTALVQIGILIICILSLPLWKAVDQADDSDTDAAGIRETLQVPGVVFTLIAFFAYCAGEATCFLWTSSYFAGTKEGMSQELIASFGSLIFGGLMFGRLISGLIPDQIRDEKRIRIGLAVEALGIVLILISGSHYVIAMLGFLLIGTGMGPIYPSIQHMAPDHFGKKYSAPVIGLQMASAYIGSTFMPTVFGFLQQNAGIGVMPLYLAVFAAMNFAFLEWAYRSIAKSQLLRTGWTMTR